MDYLFYEELVSLSFNVLVDHYGSPLPKTIPLLQLRLEFRPFAVAHNLESFLGILTGHLCFHIESPILNSWEVWMLIAL